MLCKFFSQELEGLHHDHPRMVKTISLGMSLTSYCTSLHGFASCPSLVFLAKHDSLNLKRVIFVLFSFWMDHHFIFLYERATVIWGWNILNDASMLERNVIVDLKATHVCMIYCPICSTLQ